MESLSPSGVIREHTLANINSKLVNKVAKILSSNDSICNEWPLLVLELDFEERLADLKSLKKDSPSFAVFWFEFIKLWTNTSGDGRLTTFMKALRTNSHLQVADEISTAVNHNATGSSITSINSTSEASEAVRFEVGQPKDIYIGQLPNEQLQDLEDRWENRMSPDATPLNSVVIYSAMGGVGKSELCRQFAKKVYERKANTIWIKSETIGTLTASLQRFLKQVAVAVDKNAILESLFLNYLSKLPNPSIVVFDNVEEIVTVKDILLYFEHIWPKNKVCLVFTTRNRTLFDVNGITLDASFKYDPIFVDVLDLKGATEFVTKYAKVENASNAESVAKAVGYLPLALVIASAYIIQKTAPHKVTKFDFKKFVDKISSNGFSHGQTALQSTSKQSFDKIKSLSNEAFQILLTVGFLNPDSIPVAELRHLNFKHLDRNLDLLASYNLIHLLESSDDITVHRLVQESVLACSPDNMKLKTIKSILTNMRRYLIFVANSNVRYICKAIERLTAEVAKEAVVFMASQKYFLTTANFESSEAASMLLKVYTRFLPRGNEFDHIIKRQKAKIDGSDTADQRLDNMEQAESIQREHVRETMSFLTFFSWLQDL